MTITERGRQAILGALVADSASLGFHWLYDQTRIKSLAVSAPEFRTPNIKDYADTAGYFAHAKKKSGELSQYGEQVMVMLQSLAANQGVYETVHYQTQFAKHFGYGGEYVGYIDRATRDTLNTLVQMENESVERARAVPFDGSEEQKASLMSKVLTCAKQTTGDALLKQVEMAVRISDDNDQLVSHALKMAEALKSLNNCPGSADIQLPAIAKLPALVARYANDKNLHEIAESAIRVTNNNDTSVAYGLAVTDMLETAIVTGDLAQTLAVVNTLKNETVKQQLEEALSMADKPNTQVTQHFGMACNLSYGVPALVHNLATAASYQQAVQNNIYAGGDNCGRAIVLGSIAAACFGTDAGTAIPEAWLSKVAVYKEANQLLEMIG